MDQLLNPGLVAYLRLGRKPERCSHRKDPQTVVYQTLQQDLLIVEGLSVT